MANSEIRVGQVSSVNYESGMIRVTYRDKDEAVTSEFPLISNNDEYRMPAIGQNVLVAHLSNGSSRGVVIGTLWNQKHVPTEAGDTLYRKELSREPGAAYVRYSDETGEYLLSAATITIEGIEEAILKGTAAVTIVGEEEATLMGNATKVQGSSTVTVASDGELRLTDGRYNTTLTEIMKKLEELGG